MIKVVLHTSYNNVIACILTCLLDTFQKECRVSIVEWKVTWLGTAQNLKTSLEEVRVAYLSSSCCRCLCKFPKHSRSLPNFIMTISKANVLLYYNFFQGSTRRVTNVGNQATLLRTAQTKRVTIIWTIMSESLFLCIEPKVQNGWNTTSTWSLKLKFIF